MLIIKNDKDQDMIIKVPGEDGMPVEATIAPGDTYEISDDNPMVKDILRWNFAAYLVDDGRSGDATSDAAGSESTGSAEANEDASTNQTSDDGDGAQSELVEITNDKDFDVEVTYKDENGEDKTVTIKAGDKIEVPADQEDAVKKQIDEETAPENGEQDADNAEDKAVSEERAQLAKERAELARERASLQFDKLVAEGKLVPAQRDDYMALATNAAGTISVGEGKVKTVSELLESLIENGRAAVKVDEEVGESGDGKVSEQVELTYDDEEVAKMFGNTREELVNLTKDKE